MSCLKINSCQKWCVINCYPLRVSNYTSIALNSIAHKTEHFIHFEAHLTLFSGVEQFRLCVLMTKIANIVCVLNRCKGYVSGRQRHRVCVIFVCLALMMLFACNFLRSDTMHNVACTPILVHIKKLSACCAPLTSTKSSQHGHGKTKHFLCGPCEYVYILLPLFTLSVVLVLATKCFFVL